MNVTLTDNNEYKLSAAQANIIIFTQSHQQVIMAGLLSHIASELGYKVTEHTNFELADDYSTIKITERKPESLKEAVVKAK